MGAIVLPRLASQTELQPIINDSPAPKCKILPPGPSLFLDIVRFLAAVTVVIGHLSVSCFTTGSPSFLLNWAEGAVAVFFVLSGFMIRYITTVKYGDLRRFAVDRLARIYSVAFPAMALTVLFDLLSAHINPSYYNENFAGFVERMPGFVPFAHTVFSHTWALRAFRIVLSLGMLSQSWFRDSSPLSNSPYWSLSYEGVYYAAFGIALYLRGRKRIAGFLILFLLIGPTIFLMFPLWLLGCAAYDAYQNGVKKKSLGRLFLLSLLSIACVHGTPVLIGHFHTRWFYIGHMVPWMDTVAIATVAIGLPSCIALRNLRISEAHLAVRIIRKLAAATFPLYLIHLPVFVLLAAVVPSPRAGLVVKLALLANVITFSVLLAGPCDAFKDYLRRRLFRLEHSGRSVPVSQNQPNPAETVIYQ
jgi:peptidoglycan/LPS O-acetylase OafA/YrhL